MRNLYIIILIYLLSPRVIYCQYNLIIEISPLKNNDGYILLALMDENENILKKISAKIEEKI